MKFLHNSTTANHKIQIETELKSCDEAYIAVAFLKSSGLNILLPSIKEFLKRGSKLTLVAGQNFALTEPSALHSLRLLFQDYPSSKLYLAKANSATKVFHPKFYLFQSQNNCCIITGSANITEGGLVNNKEASLVVNCSSSDSIWLETLEHFNSLIDPHSADEATLLVIKQYETYYEQQKQYNRKAKPIPNKTKSQLAFDYHSLLKHFQRFDNKKRDETFSDKMANYKEAKKILDAIADNPRLTQKQFEPLLDSLVGSKEEFNLWHSGSLFRLRRSVYPYYKEFQKLVKYIRENKSQSAATVFSNAKDIVKMIEGAAVNYITEIMMTYNPKEFANMNKNPITVLKQEGGVNIKTSTSSYNGMDYQEYCDLIKEISSKLGLRNMLEADSYFNDIYWRI